MRGKGREKKEGEGKGEGGEGKGTGMGGKVKGARGKGRDRVGKRGGEGKLRGARPPKCFFFLEPRLLIRRVDYGQCKSIKPKN